METVLSKQYLVPSFSLLLQAVKHLVRLEMLLDCTAHVGVQNELLCCVMVFGVTGDFSACTNYVIMM